MGLGPCLHMSCNFYAWVVLLPLAPGNTRRGLRATWVVLTSLRVCRFRAKHKASQASATLKGGFGTQSWTCQAGFLVLNRLKVRPMSELFSILYDLGCRFRRPCSLRWADLSQRSAGQICVYTSRSYRPSLTGYIGLCIASMLAAVWGSKKEPWHWGDGHPDNPKLEKTRLFERNLSEVPVLP